MDAVRRHRLDHIAEHVEAQYRRSAVQINWDPVFTARYRWEHTQRVAHYGDLIAKAEGHDRELCMAACLLHDIAYFHCGEEEDWREHGRIGAELSRPVLADAGFSREESDTIRYAIAIHVDGKAGFSHPPTPVADVVSDADNVDRFSAVRVVLWCMTERDDLQKMAIMLGQRVERLRTYRERSPLKTATGQRLFAEQVDLQIALFEAIIGDAAITRLPWREKEPLLADEPVPDLRDRAAR